MDIALTIIMDLPTEFWMESNNLKHYVGESFVTPIITPIIGAHLRKSTSMMLTMM